MAPPSFAFDSSTQRAVIVTALAGCISCLVVSFLLVHIVSVTIAPLFARKQQTSSESDHILLRRQLGTLIVCLFLSDFIQSISGMIQILWAAHHGVRDGPACTIQAVTLLGGDLGVCYWNAAVALHTFLTIVMRRPMSNVFAGFLVIVGWTAVITATLIGPLFIQTSAEDPIYGIAGNWCFITTNYASARLYIHYVPILLSAFLIVVLYAAVCLSLRGNLTVNGAAVEFRWKPLSHNDLPPATHITTVAAKILWYPVSYVTLILPISIARLASLRGQYVPEWVWNFAITMLFLSGFANGGIYMVTRRALTPINWRQSNPSRSSTLVVRETKASVRLAEMRASAVWDGSPMSSPSSADFDIDIDPHGPLTPPPAATLCMSLPEDIIRGRIVSFATEDFGRPIGF